jgi:arylsulfatase
VLIALGLSFGCSPQDATRSSNVVLVVVDTVRADHVGAYGYARDTSPRLDAWAADNLFFESARSQAPCTYPSVNSLLTSRDPIHFHHGQDLGIPAGFPSLPEILADHGFTTAAVSESPVVRRTPSRYNETGGFGRGFHYFDESCYSPTFRFDAACVNERAAALIDEIDGPFLLYLHYMQPHGRYQPPPSHPRRFAGEYEGDRPAVRDGSPNPFAKLVRRGEADRIDRADLAHLVDLYDDEIAYFDRRFGELLEMLEDRGLRDDTLIVLASDHGEDFLEHGQMKHCQSVFDSQVKTPLVMEIPGIEPRRLAVDAMNLDVVPTLLDWLGIDPAPFGLEGRSLLPWIVSPKEPPSPGAFSAWRGHRAFVQGRHKLIVDYASGERTLYSLDDDPGETRDASTELPTVEKAMARVLLERVRTVEQGRAEDEELREDIARRLRQIGYIE